jgi:hypothetical protein
MWRNLSPIPPETAGIHDTRLALVILVCWGNHHFFLAVQADLPTSGGVTFLGFNGFLGL